MPIKRLDRVWLEKLRKDFLTLTRNLPKVRDYNTAHELREAFRVYRANFDNLFFDKFLNKQLKYEYGLSESDVSYVNKRLRSPAWSFSLELSLPIRFVDEYWWKEKCFREFERDSNRWKNRLQKKARDFWGALKDILAWLELQGTTGFDVTVPDVDRIQYDGFQLTMQGYDPNNGRNRDELDRIKEGLRIYRRRASLVFPWLLKHQLPVTVEFEATLDKGGSYEHKTITLYASSVGSKNPAWVAHVMAHEMGHHLWRLISNGAAAFWSTAIRGDYGDLDIQELVDNWPGDIWAFQFPKEIGGKDPVLALQVDALMHDLSYSGSKGELQKKEDFQQLLDQGQKTLRVPKTPITGYANKNPEEAMCEAIGLLVAYGPRALHEKIRHWLEIIIPGEIRLANCVVASYLHSLNRF